MEKPSQSEEHFDELKYFTGLLNFEFSECRCIFLEYSNNFLKCPLMHNCITVELMFDIMAEIGCLI